jgi:hypothetical protein
MAKRERKTHLRELLRDKENVENIRLAKVPPALPQLGEAFGT